MLSKCLLHCAQQVADAMLAQVHKMLSKQRIDRAFGTIFATYLARWPMDGRRGAVCLARNMQFWPIWAVALATFGCILPVPTGEPDATVPLTVQIEKDKVDPHPPQFTVPFTPLTQTVQQFTLINAVTVTGGPAGQAAPRLFFYWYYDFDNTKAIAVSNFAVCHDDPICNVTPCLKAQKPNNLHQMIAVVATQRLNTSQKDIFDFPNGTKFDMVQWQLEILGNCPAP